MGWRDYVRGAEAGWGADAHPVELRLADLVGTLLGGAGRGRMGGSTVEKEYTRFLCNRCLGAAVVTSERAPAQGNVAGTGTVY